MGETTAVLATRFDQALQLEVATPAIEESLVDWLLEREEASGFTSVPIDGHGSRLADLTLAEQVVGGSAR